MRQQPSGFTLHLGEKLCNTLVNSIRGIVWEADPVNFRFCYVSPQAERILGYPVHQWIEDEDFWRSHIHPDDVTWCIDYCLEATARGEDHEFEYRMIAANGTIVWLHDIVTVVEAENGDIRLRGIMIDITEAKLTELKHRSGEEELYLAKICLDLAPLGFLRISQEGRILEANEFSCRSLGYSREQLCTMSVFDFDPEFTAEMWPAHLDKLREAGTMCFESTHQDRDGNRFTMEILASWLEHHGNEFIYSFEKDISERVRLHEELSLREHYQRALLDNFPYGAWMKDETGRYLAANRRLAEYLGQERPEELEGRTNYDFLPEKLCDRIAAEDRKVLTSGRTKHAEERLPVRGNPRWFDVYQSPVTINGRRIGTVGCNWDITEQKVVAQALAESEERYRKLVELSPDSVFIHREGCFVFMNHTGALLLGAERPEDLYGRSVLEFVHPDYRQKVAERINHAANHQKNPAVEMVLVRGDGSTVPVEMVSVYINYRNTDSVLAVARDISERKRIYDELVKAQRLESLGVLAGGIAHDFNNILTGIMGNISLMRHQLDPDGPLAGRLKACEKAAIRASELTLQLLTFARGGAPIKKLMDPSTLIRESATFLLHGSQLGCDLKLADDLWHIKADGGQISQVLHNILFNAMQAMPDDGLVTISAMNEELHRENSLNLPAGNYLRIDIEDQGCGIPPANLPKIFDPYFSTKSDGTGLGLASAYSVIKRHGGVIDVFSTVGTGTRFAIFLPAVSGERLVEIEPGQDTTMTGSGRILVMDDEQLIRDVAIEILTTAGYQVESCSDGKEAVAQYRRRFGSDAAFDAVIMDLTVPGGMGGKETAGHILEIDPEAILIVSSGYSNDPVIADFHKFGFRGVVTKPFSATTLVAEMRRLIPVKHGDKPVLH